MKKKTLLLSAVALSLTLSLSPLTQASAVIPAAVNQQALPSLAPMLDNVLPTVVSVYVEGKQVQRQQIPEEFRFFFGRDFPGEQESSRPFQGLGSGVIIDAKEGYIVTNNHVVINADKIKIQLNDGKEYDAKLLGSDELSDIALLQVKDVKDLKAITMADSDQLRVGDFAVAVGNPFGLGQTVTSGIISALGRSGLNMQGVENFIQTDASINRGNSGGALVNLNGELIGINTAILAPSGGNIGIGFAIPSTMVKYLTQQLIQHGEIKRGMLGIIGREMTSDMANALKIDAQRGAFVGEVMEKSAADLAGIKAGDVVVSFDGNEVKSFAELRAKVAMVGAGKKVDVGLLRDGKTINVTVTLQNSDQEKVSGDSLGNALVGATLSNSDNGVVIDDVKANSPVAFAGLKKGDIIVSVNREPVKNISELRKITSSSSASVLALQVVRGNANLFLILRQ